MYIYIYIVSTDVLNSLKRDGKGFDPYAVHTIAPLLQLFCSGRFERCRRSRKWPIGLCRCWPSTLRSLQTVHYSSYLQSTYKSLYYKRRHTYYSSYLQLEVTWILEKGGPNPSYFQKFEMTKWTKWTSHHLSIYGLQLCLDAALPALSQLCKRTTPTGLVSEVRQGCLWGTYFVVAVVVVVAAAARFEVFEILIRSSMALPETIIVL